MIAFSGRSLVVTLLIVLLLTSLSLNGILAYAFKEYYSKFRQATVFPIHTDFYQRDNAQLPPKQHKRMVLFGDSRIQEWQNLPQLEGWELVNRGIGGETTSQLKARFTQDVLALSPEVVVLQMGINDLVAIGVLPQYANAIKRQCQDHLKFMVETLQAKAITVILLSIIPPAKPPLTRLPVWSEQISQSVEEINRYWFNLPPSPYLQVIDTKKVLQNDQGQWRSQVNRDTLHLTPTGYDYLNQALMTVLTTLK